MKTKLKGIRQGDVLLKPCQVPKDAKRIAIRPIALGERTGHHHSLVVEEAKIEDCVEMYEKDGQTYVRIIGEGVSLDHQQHKSHPQTAEVLPVGGEFVYIPQVENSDWGTRQVID
jgi:hypothetical protein